MTRIFRLHKLTKIAALTALAFILSLPPPADASSVLLGRDKISLFYYFQYYIQARDTGSGQGGRETTNDMYFRRNRLGFYGDVNDTLGFYVQTQLENTPDRDINPYRVNKYGGTGGFNFVDAYLTFYFTDEFQMLLGKFKNAFSRSNLEGCRTSLTLDRSDYIYMPYRLSRDFGFAAWGNLMDAKVGYKLSVMEGREGMEGDSGNNIEPESQFRYDGRVHVALLDPEFMYGYHATYLGTRRVLTIGAGYSTESGVVYGDRAGKADKKDFVATTLDVNFEYPTSPGTISLGGAAFDYSWGGAYKGADPDTTSYGYFGERNGFYTRAGFMPAGKFGPGKIQFFLRYESWRFAKLGNVVNQALTLAEVGFNYYMYKEVLKLVVDYQQTRFDVEDGTDTNFQNYNTATFAVEMVY